MTNWQSPAEITKDGFVLLKSIHFLLGMYSWEWLISLDFDWQYLSGRRRFRWPMVFYFLNRYLLLFSLIGMNIAIGSTTKVNCQVLLTFNQVAGNMVIGLVSINFAIRTMAVWSLRWYIVAPLLILIIGHWSILMHGAFLKAEWDPQSGCIITHTDSKIFSATFIYSMCFDFILLCSTGYKLHVHMSPIGISSSRLAKLIFQDGLVYFMIAFLVNLIAATFLLLNWNAVIPIDAAAPGVVISGIVACRAVRRLANYMFIGTDIYQLSMPQHPHIPGDRAKATLPPQSVLPVDRGSIQIQLRSCQQYDAPNEPSVSGDKELSV